MSAVASPSPAPSSTTAAAKAALLPPHEAALLAELSTVEKCLVGQATYERGTSDFTGVAKLLKGHALLRERPVGYFDAERTAKIHAALTREMGLDSDEPQPPNAPQLLKVARKYYLERVAELHEAMQLEQDRFLIAYAEIEEIKEGKHDHEIHLSALPRPQPSPPKPTSFFAGLPSPDPSKPAPRTMFGALPVTPLATNSPSPVKIKGTKRGGGRGRASAAAEEANNVEARDEWLDWRPQAMPPSSGAGLEGYENGHADLLQTGQLPPLPDLGGGDGGDWGDMRGLPLPDLPELPPLPDLPALPSLGGGVEGEGQGEAMEGVEAS